MRKNAELIERVERFSWNKREENCGKKGEYKILFTHKAQIYKFKNK